MLKYVNFVHSTLFQQGILIFCSNRIDGNTHSHTTNNTNHSNEPYPLRRPTDNPRLSHHFDARTTTTTAEATTPTADGCATSTTSRSASPRGLCDLGVLLRIVVHWSGHVAIGRIFVTKTREKIFAQCHREKISSFHQRQDIGTQEPRRRRRF